MKNVVEILGASVLVVITVILLSALFAWPVMVLWNACLAPTVAGIKAVDFWAAWGIMILCNLLFKPNGSSSK